MSDAGAAQQAHARLQAILKAVVVGQDGLGLPHFRRHFGYAAFAS